MKDKTNICFWIIQFHFKFNKQLSKQTLQVLCGAAKGFWDLIWKGWIDLAYWPNPKWLGSIPFRNGEGSGSGSLVPLRFPVLESLSFEFQVGELDVAVCLSCSKFDGFSGFFELQPSLTPRSALKLCSGLFSVLELESKMLLLLSKNWGVPIKQNNLKSSSVSNFLFSGSIVLGTIALSVPLGEISLPLKLVEFVSAVVEPKELKFPKYLSKFVRKFGVALPEATSRPELR